MIAGIDAAWWFVTLGSIAAYFLAALSFGTWVVAEVVSGRVTVPSRVRDAAIGKRARLYWFAVLFFALGIFLQVTA